jgi:two-component system, chemotaxis family, response regulator Rcp1
MIEINVLLVEDSRADVLLIREALDAHRIVHEIKVLTDGEQAIDYMRRMGKSAEEPYPDILLLDMNIPKADGCDVLQEFRRHLERAEASVIIVSPFDMARDREKVSGLGVTHYFKKPTSFDAFLYLGALVKDAVERATPQSSGG